MITITFTPEEIQILTALVLASTHTREGALEAATAKLLRGRREVEDTRETKPVPRER